MLCQTIVVAVLQVIMSRKPDRTNNTTTNHGQIWNCQVVTGNDSPSWTDAFSHWRFSMAEDLRHTSHVSAARADQSTDVHWYSTTVLCLLFWSRASQQWGIPSWPMCFCFVVFNPMWASRWSLLLSSQVDKTGLKWYPAKSSYTQFSCPKRCMKVKSLSSSTVKKDGSNQSFLFYYSSADGSRGKGKCPTRTWKILSTMFKAVGCAVSENLSPNTALS